MATLSTPPFTPTASGATTPTAERKPSGSHGAPSRNPVSLQLYKVLCTNFDDESTKQALQTLSDLYSTPSSKAKEHSALSLNDHPEEDVTGHEQTSSTLPNFTENSPGQLASKARKNLRRDMENQLAEGSKRFLAALSEVDSKLGELQTHVTAIRTSCDEAETQLALTNESSKMLLERAGHLRDGGAS